MPSCAHADLIFFFVITRNAEYIFFLLQYAFNIFSHNAPILENGYNEEEMKMVKETRKIWVSESLINAHKFFELLSNFLLIYLLSKQKSDPNSVLYF
jgi:hypothetical protein